MEKPPLYFKMWVTMIMLASHQQYRNLKRGQFFTSYNRMREEMSYKVGFRTEYHTLKEIRGAFDFLKRGKMIVTTKVTGGTIVKEHPNAKSPSNRHGMMDKMGNLITALEEHPDGISEISNNPEIPFQIDHSLS